MEEIKQSYPIIGLGGTNGSGKDTVGQILVKHYDYLFFSVTELLRDEAIRQNKLPERAVLRQISAQWRRKYGLGVLVDKAIAAYKYSTGIHSGLVIASLRNAGEVDRIHQKGGIVVWIDAKAELRYQRMRQNAKTRNRPAEDNKTFKQFMEEENAEMQADPKGDTAMLNGSAVRRGSDFFILNNSDNLQTLRKTIAQTLGL